MKMTSGRVALIGILGLLTSGCATITRGTTEVLVVETTPAGADVELSNGMRCKTPCSLEMKRKSNVVVDISKEGYESVRVNVLSQISGAGAAGMAGNVILGGVIGAGVDAATGATKQLKPNPVQVTLVAKGATLPADAQSGVDATLEMAKQRCAALGHQTDTDNYRSCLSEQLKNLSK